MKRTQQMTVDQKRIPKMSLSSARQFYERQSKLLRQEEEIRNQQIQENQYEKEYQSLQPLHSYCNLQYTNLNQVDRIQTGKVEILAKQQFFNADVMQGLLCSLNALFIGSQTLPVNERVKHWLKTNRILNAGSHGYAMEAVFGQAKDLILVKGQDAELVHELFVGLQLNQLRERIPNFSYVFGGFRCLPAFLDNKSVKTWCNDPNSSSPPARLQYILYENIKPAVSMKDWIPTNRFSKFLNQYLQILLAVNMAYETMDFTHYDLHTGNVLIRSIPDFPEFTLQYTWKMNPVYLRTSHVATIIDYGMSHVRIDNQNYGVWGYKSYNILPDQSNPLYDAYKLLIDSLHFMKNEDKELAIPLLQFFTREVVTIKDLDQFVDTQVDIYSLLPPLDKRLTFESYMDLVFDMAMTMNIGLVPKPDKKSPLLSCKEQICVSKSQIPKLFGFTDNVELQTLFDVYDYIQRNPKTADKILEDPNIPLLIDDAQEQQLEFLSQMAQFFAIPIYSYETSGADFSRYKKYILNMIEYKNVYYDFLIQDTILEAFDKQIRQEEIEKYKRNLQERDRIIQQDYEQTQGQQDYQTLILNYMNVFPKI